MPAGTLSAVMTRELFPVGTDSGPALRKNSTAVVPEDFSALEAAGRASGERSAPDVAAGDRAVADVGSRDDAPADLGARRDQDAGGHGATAAGNHERRERDDH